MSSRFYAKRTRNPNKQALDPNITHASTPEIANIAVENIRNFVLDRGFDASYIEDNENDNEKVLSQALSRNIFEGTYLNATFLSSSGTDTYTLTHPSGNTRRITDLTSNVFSVDFVIPSGGTNTLTSVAIKITGWNGSVAKPLYYYDKTSTVLASSLAANYAYKITYDPTLNSGSGAFYLVSSSKTAIDLSNVSSIPKGYLYGFTLSNNTLTPNTVIDIQDGVARDNSDTVNIKIDTVFTKSISSSFTAGSGNGGRGTGVNLVNGTWYHVFAISNGSTSDVYFDTSVSAQNIPTGYTYFRRVGSIYYIDGTSGIRRFTQVGNEFLWSTSITDISSQSQSFNTETLRTLSVPSGVKVDALVSLALIPTGSLNTEIYAKHYSPDITISTLSINNCSAYVRTDSSSGSDWSFSPAIPIRTNTASQVKTNALRNTGSGTLSISMFTDGWIDVSLGVVNNSASQSITGSNTQNGYVILPNGLIMQWGVLNQSLSADTSYTITLPIAFPNAFFTATATVRNTNASTTKEWLIQYQSNTLSTLTLFSANASGGINTDGANWMAIGY